MAGTVKENLIAAREILTAAANLIEPEGKWIQGGLVGDKNGRPLRAAVTGADFCGHCWCVVGAIDKAWWLGRHGGADYRLAASHLAKDILSKSLGQAPERWNDSPGRTQRQAVSALRSAAIAAQDVQSWAVARTALSSQSVDREGV